MCKLYKGVWMSEQAPHFPFKLSDDQHKELFDKGGWAIREVYDFDSQTENNFYAIIKDQFGGFQELTKKVKTKVRKAQNTYEIRKAKLEELLEFGPTIYYNAFSKYKVKGDTATLESLERRFRMVFESDEFEAWMMFRITDNAPVGWSIVHIFDDICEYETVKVDPSFMDSTYPNYGLFFTMNQHYLEERKLKYVHAGWRSVTLHSNIQEFLIEQFNFRKAYCKMEMQYKFPYGLAISLLYPLRKIIPNSKLKSLLLQEELSRANK